MLPHSILLRRAQRRMMLAGAASALLAAPIARTARAQTSHADVLAQGAIATICPSLYARLAADPAVGAPLIRTAAIRAE
ncbi:MAG: hypothetical protein ABWZ88_08770 [Variovorax sp.]